MASRTWLLALLGIGLAFSGCIRGGGGSGTLVIGDASTGGDTSSSDAGRDASNSDGTSKIGDGGSDTSTSDTGGATIKYLKVEPPTVSKSSTGMTDQFFTITVKLGGGQGSVNTKKSEVYLSLGNNQKRPAVPGDVTVSGSTVTFSKIKYTWLMGLPAGTYPVGATIVVGGMTLQQRSLATVDVTM